VMNRIQGSDGLSFLLAIRFHWATLTSQEQPPRRHCRSFLGFTALSPLLAKCLQHEWLPVWVLRPHLWQPCYKKNRLEAWEGVECHRLFVSPNGVFFSFFLFLSSPQLRMSFIVFSTRGTTLMKLTEDR
jgi:hypothetical protein